MYPNYNSLNIKQYPRIDGMHSLGFIHEHRPDIHIITDQTENHFHPDFIIKEIEYGLSLNKKVALFFWDEDFIPPGPYSDQLNRALAVFKDQPVYLCSNMIGDQLKIYLFQRAIPIKIIYVPWWYVSLIPGMTAKTNNQSTVTMASEGYNWACLINRPDSHKDLLVDGLRSRALNGLMRYSSADSDTKYYHNDDRIGWKSSHDMKRSLTWDSDLECWIDHLSKNIPRLQQILGDCPMVIQPESTGGIFCMTEKSWWPIVLDRMFVIWARPGIMHDLQQYLSYDLSLYLDLEFDSVQGYQPQDHQRRLDCLLDKNLYVFNHARDIYPTIYPQLVHARQSLGANIYSKFCQSLDQLV